MARKAETYRAQRRALARRHKLDWRELSHRANPAPQPAHARSALGMQYSGETAYLRARAALELLSSKLS